MTISLTAIPRTIMPRLWNQHQLRRYARQLTGGWDLSLPARCLPSLGDLPLPVRPAASEVSGRPLIEALLLYHRLRIVSGQGSGRSLALHQICLQWAREQINLGERVPLLIVLPEASPSPDEALERAVMAAGLDQARTPLFPSLAAGRWLLLLDGWDELGPEAQSRWKSWICAITTRFPQTPICVVSGPTSQTGWAPFEPWEILPPDPPILRSWLGTLLPEIDPELLVGPLTSDERLQMLGRRLLEVVLLAWSYPRYGFPANRSRMFASALDQLLRRFSEGEVGKLKARLAQMAFETLSSGQPPDAPPELHNSLRRMEGLADLQANGQVGFTHEMWTRFLAATHIASAPIEQELPVDTPAWRETIALAAGLLEDPRPLYRACRGTGPVDATKLLTLGQALREHRGPSHPWSQVILGGLAQLSGSVLPESTSARALLDDMPDVLLTAILQALNSGPEGRRWATKTLCRLPAHLAAPHLTSLLIDRQADDWERREAAETLLRYPESLTLVLVGGIAQSELDPLGRQLCTALLSLGGPAGRQFLAQLLGNGLQIFPEAHTSFDRKLQVRAALALLADQAIDLACRQAARMSLLNNLDEETVSLLLQACASSDQELRKVVRHLLIQSGNHTLALRSFARLILGAGVSWAAQREAIYDLAAISDPLVSTLLRRVLSSSQLPLPGRIIAASLLALQNEPGLEQLVSALRDDSLPPTLRARIALLLGEQGYQQALGPLLELVCSPSDSPLRPAAILALGQLRGEETIATLCGLLEDEEGDFESRLTVAVTLGRLGDENAVLSLQKLLTGPLEDRLYAGWRSVLPPEATGKMVSQWQERWFPERFQWRLVNALAEGETEADRPTSLNELVAEEAKRLRSTAATSLAGIGGSFARTMLGEALNRMPLPGSERAMAVGLASLEGAMELASALQQDNYPTVHCATIQALAGLREGNSVLRHYLKSPGLDPFISGVVLEALIGAGDGQLLEVFEWLIFDCELPAYLRAQAVAGISSLGGSSGEGLLVALMQDSDQPVEIRAAAIRASSDMIVASRSLQATVRHLLEQNRTTPALTIEALRIAGKARDRQMLPLLLPYLQSDDPDLQAAAIEALADLADPSTIPLLIRISQSAHLTPTVRVTANAALVRLGGDEYLSMLRSEIELGPLPKRLLALDLFLQLMPDPLNAGLTSLLGRGVALPLRLRVINGLIASGKPADLDLLITVLASVDEAIQLRCLSAEALARNQYQPALGVLIDLARSELTPPQLRRRAIEALGGFSQQEALLTLGELALAPSPAVRGWADKALPVYL